MFDSNDKTAALRIIFAKDEEKPRANENLPIKNNDELSMVLTKYLVKRNLMQRSYDIRKNWSLFIALLSLLLLAACGSNVEVTTTFNATQDIKKGDAVFLNQQIVGEVKEVKQRDGKTLLRIDLTDQGSNQVKKKAAAVVNRLKQNKPLEIYNLSETNLSIEHGDQLQGLDSMFQLGAWMVGESLEQGSDSLLGYVTAFQQYLDSDKWQQDKQALRDEINQLGKEAENMAEVLSQELNKTTAELGKAEQQAAEAVEQLGNELAPVMGEFAKSSQAIVDELEKFSRNLEQQNAEGKELGTTVMQSLLEALEKINQSMDEVLIEENQPGAENDSQTQNQEMENKPANSNVPKEIIPEQK